MKRLRDLLTGVVPLFRPVPKSKPAPPDPPSLPTIFLTPGKHMIDGATVEVPRDGDRDLVEWPLAPGRHVVDSRITYVSDPNQGFKYG